MPIVTAKCEGLFFLVLFGFNDVNVLRTGRNVLGACPPIADNVGLLLCVCYCVVLSSTPEDILPFSVNEVSAQQKQQIRPATIQEQCQVYGKARETANRGSKLILYCRTYFIFCLPKKYWPVTQFLELGRKLS